MEGSVWTLAFVGLAIFAAGVMRGFSGFGAALFATPALSLVFPPAAIAPVMMGLQVFSGLQTLRTDWPHILWRRVGPLLACSVLVAPFGAWLLVGVPADAGRLAIGVIVLATALLLLSGWRAARAPGPVATALAGGGSGLLNGFSAMGGPPLVAYFLSGHFAASAARASMTFVFLGQNIVSLATIFALDGVPARFLPHLALALPAQVAGILLGQRLFERYGQAHYRRVCILVLGAVALLLIARAAWQLLS
ncbi:sulfite exporter TauE/SafE family protein [Hylemonella gracilis]|uniref:Probable membrane transporter protein n=1 Tax=Hylemonella gracilis ATCC 19624 TaxID=887062 RepID=F3KUU1_9BURK|nr:sulfite exporter TauE/SafE family protein [Hylemonella gracilis]EGI76434.1 hypothetical protein HGR_11127 [Hylemonella gracilis ATCC 19624]